MPEPMPSLMLTTGGKGENRSHEVSQGALCAQILVRCERRKEIRIVGMRTDSFAFGRGPGTYLPSRIIEQAV
jgi:hypothetical protein